MASALRKHHQVKCKRVPLLSNIPLQHQVLAAFGFRMEVGSYTRNSGQLLHVQIPEICKLKITSLAFSVVDMLWR